MKAQGGKVVQKVVVPKTGKSVGGSALNSHRAKKHSVDFQMH